MSTPKDQFLKDESLRNQLAAVVHTDWFKKACAFAKAEMFENDSVTTEMIRGARDFENILTDLPNDPTSPAICTSGIRHDLDSPQPQKPE